MNFFRLLYEDKPLTTVSVWRVGTQTDITRHQQLREQRSDFLDCQYRRCIVGVGTWTPLILKEEAWEISESKCEGTESCQYKSSGSNNQL